MENYGEAMQNKVTDKPMTAIEGFIRESRTYNADFRSAISRLDSLCSRLGQNNYVKNQPQKESEPKPVKSSDGIMDDLGEILRQKENLMTELRIAIDYLEQHI